MRTITNPCTAGLVAEEDHPHLIAELSEAANEDPLLALIGVGAEIWKNEHTDEYVANLRSNWGVSR